MLVKYRHNVLMSSRFIAVDGARLRRLRQERALSLRDLTSKSGVAYDTISKLETGKREAQPRTLRKLAEVLGVEPKELMRGEGDG